MMVPPTVSLGKVRNNLIIDAGMHLGEDSEYYLKKGFKVVAIEANPDLCEQVQVRLNHYYQSGQLEIINAAITRHTGKVCFYINNQASVWSTVNPDWVKRNQLMGTTSREITVEGTTFESIIQSFGVPHYLKIDIEGSDLLCLEALIGKPRAPNFISIESDKLSWKQLMHEFYLLKQLGYKKFAVINQLKVPFQTCPSISNEGQPVLHQFKPGSSGLFGNDLKDQWVSEFAAISMYRRIFLKYKLFGNYGLIPNLHNKFPPTSVLHRILAPGWFDTHARF